MNLEAKSFKVRYANMACYTFYRTCKLNIRSHVVKSLRFHKSKPIYLRIKIHLLEIQ